MTEQANTSVIRNIYEAFNRGDIETVLANVNPTAKWVHPGPATVPYYGDFSGRMVEFFQAIGGSTSGGNVTIDQYIASGNQVVTEGRYTATVTDTGARIDAPIAHFFTLHDGKVTSWRGYCDTAAVMAAHTQKIATA